MEKKLSEQMREEAQKEENDLSYMGKMKKVFRQERALRNKSVEELKAMLK